MVARAIGVTVIFALAACGNGAAKTSEPTAVAMPSATTLTEISGDRCQPPNTEAAVSGHWAEPSGC